MDACADEAMYPFEELEKTPGSHDSDSAVGGGGGKKTPQTLSGSKFRRRKRLRENLAQLASGGEADRDSPSQKRRSSEMPRRSLSTSFLDATADSSNPLTGRYSWWLLHTLFFVDNNVCISFVNGNMKKIL